MGAGPLIVMETEAQLIFADANDQQLSIESDKIEGELLFSSTHGRIESNRGGFSVRAKKTSPHHGLEGTFEQSFEIALTAGEVADTDGTSQQEGKTPEASE